MAWRLLVDWQYNQTRPVIEAFDREMERILATADDSGQEYPFHPDTDWNVPIDFLLGLGVVVLQGYLSTTAETIRKARMEQGLTTPPAADLLRHFGTIVDGTSQRDMQTVWHLANYWKHRDQWDDDWSNERCQTKNQRTIEALEALDIHHDTMWPWISAIERILGTADPQRPALRIGDQGEVRSGGYSTLAPLLERARKWRSDCLTAYPGTPRPVASE
jgi:hypothetical protein